MENKVCTKCNLEKSLNEFSFMEKRNRFLSICKKCMSKKTKEYRENNKVKVKEYADQYRKNNKEKMKEYKKNNKERIQEHKRKFLENNKGYYRNRKSSNKYYENNKDKVKEKNKNYYNNNREFLNENNKQYYQKNKDKINDRLNHKYNFNITYKLKKKLRNVINRSLKQKRFNRNSKINEILGCSLSEFKFYLESKFKEWMTWENHGLYDGEEFYGWDLDHIIPLSSAKSKEDILRLNHYTNFQPLCSYTNRVKKRNKVEWDYINTTPTL